MMWRRSSSEKLLRLPSISNGGVTIDEILRQAFHAVPVVVWPVKSSRMTRGAPGRLWSLNARDRSDGSAPPGAALPAAAAAAATVAAAVAARCAAAPSGAGAAAAATGPAAAPPPGCAGVAG
jgi:hypothetical protein